MELSLSQHMSVFESAVKLYKKHSSLEDIADDYDRLENPALESCLIKYRSLLAEVIASSDSVVNLMWNEMDCTHKHIFCSYHHSSSTRTCERGSSSLFKVLCMYIRGHEASLDDLSRKEISGVLNCIVMKAFYGVGKSDTPSCAHMNAHPSTYLLAAILQLMGSSLSKIACITKAKGDSGHSLPLDHNLLQVYYDYTIDLLETCIGQCPSMHPIGIVLNKIMAKMPMRNKQSYGPVVSNFIGEIYLKFQMGSELLCKGYVFILKSLLSFLALEHGGIDILRALMESPELSVDSSGSTSESILSEGESLVAEPRTSSIMPRVVPVIVNYLKKRQEHSLSHIQDLGYGKEEMIDAEEELDLSKSGQASMNNPYIESVIKFQGTSKNHFDLTDFIVCKKGKDYYAWLKKRHKIRKHKYHKEFFERMKRRKELLGLLFGQ